MKYQLIGCSKSHEETILGSFADYFEANKAKWNFEGAGFSYFLIRF